MGVKKIATIAAGLVAVLCAVLVIALSRIDANDYKDDLVALVEARTGRDLAIDGPIELVVSLSPSLVVEDVRLGNAEWASRPEMLRVARLELEVALLPLLGGEVRVDRLALFSPEIHLETNHAGVGNWIPDVPADETPAPSADATGPRLFAVDEIEVRDARVTFRDGRTGTTDVTTIDEILLVPGRGDGPVAVAVRADYNGIPVEADGAVGTAERFLRNSSYPVDLSLRFGEATLTVAGEVARPLHGKGVDLALDLRADSLAGLVPWQPDAAPRAGPVELSGQLADTGEGYGITGLKLRLAESDLSGELAYVPAERPHLTARLYANRLDIAGLTGSGKTPTPAGARVFPATPLPTRVLVAFDADVTLDVRELDLGDVALENVNARAVLEQGDLRLAPFTANVAGGALDSTLRLQAEEDLATVDLDLAVEGLLPGRLPAFANIVEEAPTDLSIDVRGTGRSIAEIMAGLDGDFLVTSGPGLLKSQGSNSATSDLIVSAYRKLNPAAGDDETNRMECAVAKFDIRDGIAATDRGIALATRKMNVIGSGLVNLETEGLDIGFTPQAREGVGISTGQLAELVRLRGTLAEPKAGLDTKATLMTGVSAGAAIATSGLSILAQGLYDRLTADDDPCATALASDTGMSRDDKSSSEKAVDRVKGVGESIKETFRGLFGN